MLKKIKYVSGFLLLSLSFLFLNHPLFAQTDPETAARKLFDSGQYQEALPVFRDLIRLYPNDEDLNYYLGASLSETNQYTGEARRALDIAKKKIPESYFYLGKYFHVRSDWKNAILNYEKFKNTAGKKSVSASSVTKLLDLCRIRNNPFSRFVGQEDIPADTLAQKPETPVVTQVPPADIPDRLKDSLIHFQVNAVVSYMKLDHFRFKDSQEAFVRGWTIEQNLQKKLAELSSLRQKYGSLAGPAQDSLVDRILKLEQETYRMSQQSRDAYEEANQKEAGYWNQAGALEVQEFRKVIAAIQDSVQAATEERKRNLAVVELPVLVTDTVPATHVADVDEVQPLPAEEVVYKIQIGAYRNAPPEWVQGQFRKLAVIRRIDQRVDEKGVTVYTVGELKTYADAVQMQKQIRMEGIKNAFVAAYRNQKRIALEEAKKITEQ